MPEIVCVAGRNELDEAAGLLLVHLLSRERGIEISPLLPPDGLSSYASSRPAFNDPDVVCLSLISTSSPARARYLVRRIRRRAPRASIIIGFWGLAGSEPSADEITAATSAQVVAFSLREAIAKIDSMMAIEKSSVPAT